MRLPWLGLALVFFALATPAPVALADQTVGLVSDACVVLTRFLDARIDRQDAVWIGLLTDRLRTSPPSTTGPTGQISNPCWYRYEVLSFAPQTSGSIAATVRILPALLAGRRRRRPSGAHLPATGDVAAFGLTILLASGSAFLASGWLLRRAHGNA